MSNLLLAIVTGVSLGAVLSLIALGLVLAFRATEVFNFAHGEFMLLPAFIVGQWEIRHDGPAYLGVAIALGVTAVLAGGFYLLVLRRTVGMPLFMPVIATLGLAAVLDGAMELQFGTNGYSLTLPGLPTGVVHAAGVAVPSATIATAVIGLGLSLLVAGVLRYTHLGVMVRAAGQDPLLASQSGINVRAIYLGSWCVAGLLAAVAGVLYASTQVVSFDLVTIAFFAFPAIILGGLDSIGGVVIGGLLVGLIQGFISVYWTADVINVVTYGALLVVLLIRPTGIFGTRTVVRL
jgi:branched-chain amino acid transport system permease protein